MHIFVFVDLDLPCVPLTHPSSICQGPAWYKGTGYPKAYYWCARYSLVWISAMGAFVHFNQCNYIFPKFNVLISHVMTADILEADEFMQYVGEKLCLSTTWFDLLNFVEFKLCQCQGYKWPFEESEARFPSKDVCYSCEGTLESHTYTVQCCGMEFHQMCKRCPYCHKSWVSLKCAICRFTCMPQNQQFLHESLSARMAPRMTCCSADVHNEWKSQIKNKCPACKTQLIHRFPVSPKEFCNRRWILSQMEMRRRELVATH